MLAINSVKFSHDRLYTQCFAPPSCTPPRSWFNVLTRYLLIMMNYGAAVYKLTIDWLLVRRDRVCYVQILRTDWLRCYFAVYAPISYICESSTITFFSSVVCSFRVEYFAGGFQDFERYRQTHRHTQIDIMRLKTLPCGIRGYGK